MKRFVTDDMRMKDDTIQKFASLVSKKTGLRVGDNDGAAVRKTVGERMGLKKLASPEEYLRLLESDTTESATELDALISPLMVGRAISFATKGSSNSSEKGYCPSL